jgi:hypothetical protein
VLKNSAPELFGKEPELGNQFGAIVNEILVTTALTEPFD